MMIKGKKKLFKYFIIILYKKLRYKYLTLII